MKRILALLAGVSLCMLIPAAANAAPSTTPRMISPRILAFDTMFGVDGAFVGDTNPIRGIVGDELPWEVGSVHGRLMANGRLMIMVRGLVFANDPSVPPDLVGTNDEPTFRGAVSCLTEANGQVQTVNVFTQGFKATPTGNSDIIAMVQLPNPCVAPIVFILAGSEDKWFAVTGIETESN